MTWIALTDLPSPPTEGLCDLQLLYGAGDQYDPHLLVYEVERSFLSAPRHYALLSFINDEQGGVELSDEDDQLSDRGLFEWKDKHSEEERQILFSVANTYIVFICRRFVHLDTIVASSARQALADYLNR